MPSYRRECLKAVEIFQSEFKTIHVNQGIPRQFEFLNGIYITVAFGLRDEIFLPMEKPGVIEGLEDMAYHEGVKGQMIIYGVEFTFRMMEPHEMEGGSSRRR